MGKVEDRHSVGGRGRKRVLARNVSRVAWGALFNGEDALRAGKGTNCSGQALNCLAVPFFHGEEV